MPLLRVRNVSCMRNNQHLFLPVSFEIGPHRILQLKGHNGIGKSTLLKCLAGFCKPKIGEIFWNDVPLENNADFENSLAFLGHKIAVKSSLTVTENLLWSTSYTHKPTLNTLQATLVSFGLETQQHQISGTLSSGQRQRVALARLSLSGASLWILDEPFTALDHEGSQFFVAVMKEHLAAGGAIIFSSHQTLNLNYDAYESINLKPCCNVDWEIR